jgi:hypothetical protein
MKRLVLGAGLLVAACSQGNGSENGQNAVMTPAPSVSPATPAPSLTPSVAAENGRLPPADGAQPRFIGRWAATKQLCKNGAWRFYATHLDTAGEVSCSYHRADKVPGGYDLHATCTAEAPPVPDLIKLRFAESAQAMLVDSRTLKSVGLIYCGALN